MPNTTCTVCHTNPVPLVKRPELQALACCGRCAAELRPHATPRYSEYMLDDGVSEVNPASMHDHTN